MAQPKTLEQALLDYKITRTSPASGSALIPQAGKPSMSAVTEHCPLCGGRGFFRQNLAIDHPDFGKPVLCPGQWHQPERQDRLLGLSDLSPYEKGIRLEHITGNDGNRAMLKAARDLINEPYGWLYVYGGPGNGKSDVLISLVNHFALLGHTALYIKFSRLVNIMRQAKMERGVRDEYRKDKAGDMSAYENLGYIDLFERVKQVYCLAIDEIDKTNMTAFAEEFRFDFFDERYRMTPDGQTITLFASQTPPDVLPGPLADRFYDGAFRVIKNTQPSARASIGQKWRKLIGASA